MIRNPECWGKIRGSKSGTYHFFLKDSIKSVCGRLRRDIKDPTIQDNPKRKCKNCLWCIHVYSKKTNS